MKKIILGCTLGALSLGLIGCGTMLTSTNNPVNAGFGLVSNTVTGVGTGVVTLVGMPATRADIVVYRRYGVVHHHGHAYHIRSGKYVLVR